MWQAYDAVERLAGAAKTLLAARVEESGVAQRAGDRGAAEYLARKSGSTLGAARASLDASKKVAELPHTTAALRRGELSRPQAEEIANAAAANPGAEQSLLHKEASSSLSELREVCARTRAQADPDPEATHRRIRRERRLRRWTDGEGAWNLAARGTPDAGSRFNAALDPIIDELFHAARRQGRHESREAYAFDAVVELARRYQTESDVAIPIDAGESGIGARAVQGDDASAPRRRSVDPTHLALLRVDREALVRGHTDAGGLCEIAGVGPIPIDAAGQLLGESILKLVITNWGRRRQRHPPRPWADHGPTRRPPLDLTGVHGPRVPTIPRPGHPARPPNTLDPGPRHHPRQHRPPMRPPSRPEDTARLGAGGGDWSTTNGSTRRPPAPGHPGEGLTARRRPAAIGTAAPSTTRIRRRRVTRRSCVARRGWRGCGRSTGGTSALPNPKPRMPGGRGGRLRGRRRPISSGRGVVRAACRQIAGPGCPAPIRR